VEYSNDTFNQLLAWLGSHVLTKDGVKMFIARIEKKANEPIRSAVKSLRRADARTHDSAPVTPMCRHAFGMRPTYDRHAIFLRLPQNLFDSIDHAISQ
jgi:hypothetical protein